MVPRLGEKALARIALEDVRGVRREMWNRTVPYFIVQEFEILKE